MFPAMVLIAWRPPSLRRVPASPVPRPLRYYEAATTSRRACPSAYVFASGFRPGSIVRVRCRAPGDVRAHRRARSFVHPALQGPGLFRTGDDGTSQVPWRPLPRLCPALRPRPNRSRLAMSSRSMLPPDPTRRRLRRFHDFEAATGLQRPLSTLHERRCRRPCKTRFRLAGSAFAGRASNPLGRFERFQVTSILLSRAYPDASWSHLRRRFYDLVKGGNAPIAGEALERTAARDKTPRRVARRVVETIAAPEIGEPPAGVLGVLRRHPVTAGIGLIAGLAAFVTATLWYLHARHYESTDASFVDGRPIYVDLQVSGVIEDVPVTDNQIVKTGDLLVRIDARD